MNSSAKNSLHLVALCLGALYLHGCLELVRRPAEPVVYGPQAPPAAAADSTGAIDTAPIVVVERPKRSRNQRKDIAKVNEYALWCIENAMWNEARSHMERAIAQDSLSASLHNNLGIVYERLGQVDKAADFYGRAQALNPAQKAYAANLTYLQQRQQAHGDSTAEFNIFRLDEDPRRRGARRPDDQPTYTGE